jgi:hypothetical protein
VGLTRASARRRPARTLTWRSLAGPVPVQDGAAQRHAAPSSTWRSCGPARRLGPRQPAGGCAQAPRHPRAPVYGPRRAGHPPVHLGIAAPAHGQMVAAGAGPDRRRAVPRAGSAIARTAREPGLARAGRSGSARRAGSVGSSRPTPRMPWRPRQWSGWAVARGGHRPGTGRKPAPRSASPMLSPSWTGYGVREATNSLAGSVAGVNAPPEHLETPGMTTCRHAPACRTDATMPRAPPSDQRHTPRYIQQPEASLEETENVIR